MTNTITPEELYFGAPETLTINGIQVGALITANPKLTIGIEVWKPDIKNAKGPVKGTAVVRKVLPKLEVVINQMSAARLALAMPGCTAVSSASVGQVVAGLATTLAADPALGATNVKVASVTTVNVDDFIRIGPASPTAADSEVVRVVTVGTTGGGGTGLDVVSDTGAGLDIDHANAEEVKTVTGTTLAAPSAAAATNVKLASVTGLAAGDWLRIGYKGDYETRQVHAVGTAGAGGTGVDLETALSRPHGFGTWAIEVTGQGSTHITWTPGRVATSDYVPVVMVAPGLDGRTYQVTLDNCMSANSIDMEWGDDKETGLPLVLEAHYDPATPTVVPFAIDLV